MAAKRKPVAAKDEKRSAGQAMRTRAFAMPPISVAPETNSFSFIVATETPVRTWIPEPSGRTDEYNCPILVQVDEVLPAAAVDLSRARGMPLLDSHDSWSLESVLGRIDSISIGPVDGIDGDCVLASATLSPRHVDLMPDISGGFLPNISAGYIVTEYEPLVPQPSGVPLARAASWTLLEASLVPIGSDPNAAVRGVRGEYPLPRFRAAETDATNPNQNTENTMTLDEAIKAATDAVAASELAVAELVTTAGDADAAELTDDVKKQISALCGKVGADDPYAAYAAKADTADSADDTAQESTKAADEAEVRSLSKSARSLGLGSLVEDLRSLGNGVTEIRSAIREALVKRSSAVETSPAPKEQPEKRSVDPYASYNKRS